MMTIPSQNSAHGQWKSWVFLALIILFVVFVRVRLADFPLERDEGEYAYMGQLMLQGISPYISAYNMKFPGTYAMYALIMSVFGQNIQGIHFGLTIVNCVTVLLVFLLARKLLSGVAALAAGATYALLSLSPSVLGFAAHATHFVVLPALGGVLLLLFALRNNKGYAYFLSGVLFGLAVLMKQPGFFFFLFGATYILYHHFSIARGTKSKTLSASPSRSPLKGEGTFIVPTPVGEEEYNPTHPPLNVTPPPSAPPLGITPPGSASPPLKIRGGKGGVMITGGGRGSYDLGGEQRGVTNDRANSLKGLIFNLGIFTAGGAAPLIMTVSYLYAAGAFNTFWFWTVEYASKYGSQIPLSAAFGIFTANVSDVARGYVFLWAMAVAGFIGMFFCKGLKGKRFFIGFFSFFSFLTVCPGFYFRPHYFITLLPAVSILIGIFVYWLNDKAAVLFRTRYAKFAGIVLFIFAAGVATASERSYLFQEDPTKLARTIYGANPFPESLEIARFIESHSAATDRVAVFGSEPQLFFYSGRHSATGYIYVYSLMEKHEYSLSMQKEMIREVMSSDPKFIIVVKIATSWLMRPDSEKYIFGWLNDYVLQNYTPVGVADIISPDVTVYKWYGDVKNYTVQSHTYVLIFQKR